MVNKCCYKLTDKKLRSYKNCQVILERLELKQVNRVPAWGLNLKSTELPRYQKGQSYKISKRKIYNEILIDGKAARVNLNTNSLNLQTSLEVSKRRRRMLNDNSNKGILKKTVRSPSKAVSFNNTYYISKFSPRPNENKSTTVNYESKFKEYLTTVQMNGACSTPEQNTASTSKVDTTAMEGLEETPPKRKRGRPKGSGNKKKEEMSPPPPPPPSTLLVSPPRKRGWPLGVPRKVTPLFKGKRGRPRKVIEFGFHTIVSDIKTISLPSDLWSAHVSVTAKKSQVCFTRVVQAVSNTVPVECDRSVKFNGTLKHQVRINNREVDLLASPPRVTCMPDVEILLQIVNDISINDPTLEYLNR